MIEGVPGKAPRPRSSQLSLRSSSDSSDGAVRGAAASTDQARALTATADTPAGPASAFCGPMATISSPSSSTGRAWAPKEATASTTSSAPRALASAAMAVSGLRAPLAASPWTTARTSTAGAASRARRTASTVIGWPGGATTSVTLAPPRRSQAPKFWP
jgi:hypothetical protein